VAISPQTIDWNAKVKEKLRLGFPVLSDPGHAYARQLNLAWSLPDDLRTVYRGFGIDLPSYNGDDSWELPLSTRLVVDQGGVIRAVDADPDYTVRPEAETSLEVVRGLG
jgi:peroxiredoxin